jgi:dolichyl-phosphate-mannose--protein O-mannosyl transferase
MILGLVGLCAGGKGHFSYSASNAFHADYNYKAVRIFCSLWGAFVPLLSYITLRVLKMPRSASVTGALMILFGTFFISPIIDFVNLKRSTFT